jgi:autotransporter-associated beta strand protein
MKPALNLTRMAAVLGIAITSLTAAPVIYEPFAQAAGILNGKAGGTGLSGNWTTTTGTSAINVVTPSPMIFGALAMSGGHANLLRSGNTNGRVVRSSALADAGLLNNGATLWFSLVLTKTAGGGSNEWAGFAFGTSHITSGPGVLTLQGGNGVGFRTRDTAVTVGTWNGTTTPAVGDSLALTYNVPSLIVGKIEWGATDSDVETITLYKPTPDLSSLGTGVSKTMPAVTQSAFNTISFSLRDVDPMNYDEIRFGATQADVMPVDTVAPTLLSITDNQAGGPIGEDVVAITYNLTFDKHMDLTTITAEDFDNAGSATVSIGTITQPAPGIIRVEVLPTTTGTIQLRIPATSGIKSLAQVDLDTSTAILDDTTITINAGSTPDSGLRHWDGAITSGITDGISQGGNGTWNTTSTNWDKGAGFAGPVAWNNANLDTVILGGTAGTITIGEPVTANGITSGVNYTIQSSALTLDAASGKPAVNVTANTLTINSQISGSKGLQKDGAGTLRLGSNSNDFSGGVTLNAGDLFVESVSPYNGWGTGTLTINGGRVRTNTAGTFTTTNNSIWIGNFDVFRGTTGTATWNHNGNVTLGGNVTVNSPNNFFVLNIDGSIEETGGSRKLTITGSGLTLNLNKANTFGGGLDYNASGTLGINHAYALGNGTLTITGARLIDNISGNPVTVATNNVQAWNGDITFTGTNDLNLGTGAVTMNANRTVTVTAGKLTIGGSVAQSGGNRTLNKTGNGTLVLSGANSYAGNTTVTAGTLALVGGSQNSAITVNNLASLGFTLGSPTTSSEAVTLSAGHSIVITGTVNNSSDYLLMTATSFTGTPTLSDSITDYELQLREDNTELWLAYTGTGGSTPYDAWAATFLPGNDVSNPAGDNDNDGLSNLLEFAFGTNPTVSDAGALTWDGTNFTAGSPVVKVGFPGGGGVDFTARFIRRKDHGDSGSAAYAWQFSSDLSDWEASDDAPAPGWLEAPTVLATDGDYELVEVPYPFFLDSGKKASFFRVGVDLVP